MAKLTKLRTRKADDTIEVVVLVTHPMETGQRKEKDSGKLIPPHFIQEMTVEVNGKQMVEALTGAAVSENPLLTFRFGAGALKNGDKVKVSWKDNKGGSESAEVAVEV